tara:strand:+ start:14304 stop:14768 length:465 start_codon:yes stop_codon:yes gene_type:complete
MKNIIEKHLDSMGFSLPKSVKTVGTYTSYLKEKNLLYISGQLPIKNNKILYTGKINNKNKKYGYRASELCALNILALVNIAIKGNINKIKKCLRLNGFVNTNNNFYDIPFVINGASDLIKNILKEKGIHTRTAIGVYNLPLNASVEIDAVFLIK